MASLENKRIKDTYQSLIKTEDNGNVGSTLKTITDGLGNPTSLEVSSSEVKVNGALSSSTSSTDLLSVNSSEVTQAITISSVGTSSETESLFDYTPYFEIFNSTAVGIAVYVFASGYNSVSEIISVGDEVYLDGLLFGTVTSVDDMINFINIDTSQGDPNAYKGGSILDYSTIEKSFSIRSYSFTDIALSGLQTFNSLVLSDNNEIVVNGTASGVYASAIQIGTGEFTCNDLTLSQGDVLGYIKNGWIKKGSNLAIELGDSISIPSGNVGIGTQNPTAVSSGATTLHITGSTTTKAGAIRLDSSDASVTSYIYPDATSGLAIATSTAHNMVFRTSNTERMRITNGGQVCINRTSGNGVFNVSGSIYLYNFTASSGTYNVKYNVSSGLLSYDTSSERYKHNIRESKYGLSDVLKIESKAFEYNDTNKTDIGFIAEQVYEVIPELVALDNENRPDAVSYDRFTSVLVKAIQEQQEIINDLKSRIETLEAK